MLPALIVGGLTAWYLGVRTGVIVAVATAVALLAANFVPGLSITVYALVIAWCAALYFFGPKISKTSKKSTMWCGFGSPFSHATGWAKKTFGSFFSSGKK
jgi:hypothetical protein